MTNELAHMSLAQFELLAMLSEEAGEIVLAVGKILRHGYSECHPDNTDRNRDNRADLEHEIGDLLGVVRAVVTRGDLDPQAIEAYASTKMQRAAPYLHHNKPDPTSAEPIVEVRKVEGRMTLGVGDGTGKLFVHGDYESVKTVGAKLSRLEKLEAWARRTGNSDPVVEI